MSERLERRFSPDIGTGTFSGYAVVWDELDRHRTAFRRGAFAASLSEHRAEGHRLPMLWSHDQARVVGAWDEVREDDTGLFVRGRLLIETTEGADAYARLRAGALNGLSVGFRRLADEARSGGGRTITTADLAEISLVAVPSGHRARIHEVRADPAARAAHQHGGSDMEHENGAAPETRADDTMTDDKPDLESRVDRLETTVGEVKTTVDEIKTAVTATEKRADRLEARSSRAGVSAPANDGPPLETRAFTAFVRRGREAMGADEVRSLTVADDTSGGYLAPSDFRAQVIKGIEEISPIRQHATVTSTAAGELVMPKLTGRPTAVWVGETDDRSSTEPTFGQVTIPAHEASVYVDVSQKLLEDSAINVASELSAMLATEYARLEGVAFVSGNGVGKPRGVMAHGDLPSMKNGSTSALDADKLIALMYAITAAYRSRAKWFMNGSTIAAVRSLKSSTSGEYLFKESLADGVPPTLLGKPVIEVSDMDDATSGKLPILFGDMAAAYRVVDRVGLSLLRDPYTQATSGLVRFHSRRRVGADLVLPEAVKALAMTSS